VQQPALRSGHVVALVGAAVTAVSLWLPWYMVSLPDEIKRAAGAQTTQLPSTLGEVARELISVLPSKVSATGWQALHSADAVLMALALVGAAVVLLATGVAGPGMRVDAAAAGRIAAIAGAVAAVLVVVKIADRPGPSEPVSVRYGAWLALGGAVAMAVGGCLAASGPERPVPAGAAEPVAFSPDPPSVPPPR